MKPSSLLALPLLLAVAASVAIANTNAEVLNGAAPAPSSPEPSPPPPPPSAPSPALPTPPVNLPASSPVTDVNDRTIQQVGRFAVVAYFFNTGSKLEFVNVISGQTQPYNGGDSYRLVITAAGPRAVTSRYSVSVWGVYGTTTWQLWSFAPN